MKKLYADRTWKKIQSENRIFYYVNEPSRNMTSHRHFSLWIPAEYISKIAELFYKFFNDHQIHIYTTKIPHNFKKIQNTNVFANEHIRLEKCDHEIKYYALKYLKQLKNEDDSPSDTALWYFYHGITAFTTSRSTVPMGIYRKVKKYGSVYSMTKKYQNYSLFAWTNIGNNKLEKILDTQKIMWYTPKYQLVNNKKNPRSQEGYHDF